MGLDWKGLDSGFPTFTEGQDVKSQVRKIYDFLGQMRQGIKHILSNLTWDNFNKSVKQELDTRFSGIEARLKALEQAQQSEGGSE